MNTTDHRPASTTPATCDDGWTPTHVTRSLLGWGIVAGPFYVVVSLAQALTRDGFDLTRHQWSLLENGDLGWVQVANFVLTGLMVVAYAVGLGRALAGGPGSRWAPVLTAAFGVVLARRFSGEGSRRLARFSRLTGVVFLGGFLCVASGAGSVAANLVFTGAVVLVFAWLAVVAVHVYRSLAD